jgi:hypothetical protein
MRWFVRAVVYALLLTWPAHLISPAYQGLLVRLTGWLSGTPLAESPNAAVDLSAANLLSVFVALCLASGFVSWSRRFKAIALGLVFLVLVECATGLFGMRLALASATSPGSPSAWHRIFEQLLELSRWLAVPLCWGVLLGREVGHRDAAGSRAGRSVTEPRRAAS